VIRADHEAEVTNPTGEAEKDALRVDFDRRVTMQFAGLS
jgi:hypothetical protein